MTTAAVTKRPRRAREAEPVDVDQAGEEFDEEAGTIEPTRVIPPELRFTTEDLADEDVPDEADRSIEFDLDGFVGTIVAPHKLEEVLAQLMEAGARRASTADALFAGRRFLERVLSADTLDHLQRRLDDDLDPFRISHLYDILEKVVKILNKKLEEENRARGGRPARRRRGR
ncbi:hypothetical protein AB0F17_28795 [Nonomuraea sp. NPDC026600]|uniref:hypothetical protein n=1 Tax=Nonomuraea sp. NPDC026600 TaxID=3155363 RepID=UPI00340D6B94